MKIATWNVNSINVRMPQLLDWLSREDPDIVCLQEIKCTNENFPFATLEQAGYRSEALGQKSYNGVAILSKFPIENTQKNFPDDDEEAAKRMIAARINGVNIINLYVPNGTELGTDKFFFKLEWLQKLRRWLDRSFAKDELVLLCGDFNVAPEEPDVWDVAAWEGKLHFTKTERAAIYHISQWGFTDCFRKINGNLKEFSWWNYREGAWQRNHGLRIDHIWTSQPLADACTACFIDKSTRGLEKPSDHAPVIAVFDLKK